MGHYPANFIEARWDCASQCLHTPWEYRIPCHIPKKDADRWDADIIIAIRPEHIKLSQSHDRSRALPVDLEFVEDMGSDKILFLRTQSTATRILARIPVDQVIDSENLAIEFSLQHANLFLKTNGRKLQHG